MTQEFLGVLESYFIDKFLQSIYRGWLKSNEKFYSNLLRKVKAYLKEICLFSGDSNLFLQGKKVNEDMWEDIKVFTNKIYDKTKHETIKETEMLPYYLKYREGNEIHNYVVKGMVIINTYSEERDFNAK